MHNIQVFRINYCFTFIKRVANEFYLIINNVFVMLFHKIHVGFVTLKRDLESQTFCLKFDISIWNLEIVLIYVYAFFDWYSRAKTKLINLNIHFVWLPNVVMLIDMVKYWDFMWGFIVFLRMFNSILFNLLYSKKH